MSEFKVRDCHESGSFLTSPCLGTRQPPTSSGKHQERRSNIALFDRNLRARPYFIAAVPVQVTYAETEYSGLRPASEVEARRQNDLSAVDNWS